jgi:hypothetical protein
VYFGLVEADIAFTPGLDPEVDAHFAASLHARWVNRPGPQKQANGFA